MPRNTIWMTDSPVGTRNDSFAATGLRVVNDRSSPSEDGLARLDGLFADALRFASPRSETPLARSLMRATLAEACGLSRANGLEPERVIVRLKATWVRMSETSFATRDEAHLALERAITACIEQYFVERERERGRDGSPAPSAEAPRG
jgi:hypothetical protein